MPRLRSSTIAARRQRIVSGEKGSVNGHPVRLVQRLALVQDAVVPWRRLDREAERLEAADEFANVLPHTTAVRRSGEVRSRRAPGGREEPEHDGIGCAEVLGSQDRTPPDSRFPESDLSRSSTTLLLWTTCESLGAS